MNEWAREMKESMGLGGREGNEGVEIGARRLAVAVRHASGYTAKQVCCHLPADLSSL